MDANESKCKKCKNRGIIMVQNDGEEQRYGWSPLADGTLAGDRAAVYHRGSRCAITLNPAGTVLWQALSMPRTAGELAGELQGKWTGLDEATARRDVEAFLGQLREHDMVVEV